MTRWIGDRLRDRLAYRGGFSVDGILTADGFRPTDLNTRVTSAFETVPPPLRVAVHAAAAVARAELPDVDVAMLEQEASRVFDEMDDLVLRAPVPGDTRPAVLAVRWSGSVLGSAQPADPHGVIEVSQAARGTVVSVRLMRKHLPHGLSLQAVAVAAFRSADQLLNTGFGQLVPPDTARGAVPLQAAGAA